MSAAASRPLSSLATRWRAAASHDEAEAAAMAEHYAAPPGFDPPSPDPFAAGLARGFHAHRTPISKETHRHV